MAEVQQPIRPDPDDPDQVIRFASAAGQDWRDEEAVPILLDAIARRGDDARLWQMLGIAYRNLDDLAAAVRAFGEAAKQAPADPLIAHSLARSLLEGGLPAAEAFERAHRLAPLQSPILLGRAAAYLAEGAIGPAIAGLDAQLLQHPAWIEGHGAVARLRWMRGERDAYTTSFERALAGRPKDGVLWREFVSLLLRAGQYDAANRAIAQARANLGASRILDLLEATVASESGDLAAAEAGFARVRPVEDAGYIVPHVRHLIRAGRFDLAAAQAERHALDDPGSELWPLLGIAWRMLGDARWAWLEGDDRFVTVHDLANDIGPIDRLAERLRALHILTDQPLDQSLRGGTQTDGPLFSRADPEIQALRAAVLAAVGRHVAQLPERDARHPLLGWRRDRVRFAGSWSVRLTGGGHHVDHVHPAGWISSALYVALPTELEAQGVMAGWLTLGAATELGVALAPLRTIEPRPGRLVLFPSTMWHGTRPFAAGERLTVAFDIARPPR